MIIKNQHGSSILNHSFRLCNQFYSSSSKIIIIDLQFLGVFFKTIFYFFDSGIITKEVCSFLFHFVERYTGPQILIQFF